MVEYASREKRRHTVQTELEKFLKEIFKKYLTSEGACGIIVKLSARAGSEKVIEN